MRYRNEGPIDPKLAAFCVLFGLFTYSAWLTHIVSCAEAGLWVLLVAGAIVFPVGIVHGFGVWFGGW